MPNEHDGTEIIFNILKKEHSYMLSREEAAKLLDFSITTIHRLIEQKKLKTANGRILLWSIAEYLCKG